MRRVAGFLLVCAAILKAVEIVNEPAASMASPLGRWFLPLQIGIELGFGLLVLSGLYWKVVRWLTLLLFTGFAGYSLYLAIGGAMSCDCFGPLRIHPWWTFFLDVAVVLGLLVIFLRGGREQALGAESAEWRLVGRPVDRRKIIAAMMGVAVVTAALLARYVDNRSAVAGEGLVTAGSLVILEPEQWIGQKLPIADVIDVVLSSGEWTVLLHRHDCPACHEAMPRYEQLAILILNLENVTIDHRFGEQLPWRTGPLQST